MNSADVVSESIYKYRTPRTLVVVDVNNLENGRKPVKQDAQEGKQSKGN